MKPYELEDWVDFVRGLGDERDRQAQRRYLDASGDDDAARDVRLLTDLREALREDLEGPPESLSWTARAIAGVRPDLPMLPPLELIAAYPPLTPAESRRQIYLGARKLLYQGGRFDLDVWIEDPHGTHASIVMGQVSARDEEGEMRAVDGASVFLIERGRVAGSTLTNRFGEFHLEASPEGALGLQILIRDQGKVELSLPREEL